MTYYISQDTQSTSDILYIPGYTSALSLLGEAVRQTLPSLLPSVSLPGLEESCLFFRRCFCLNWRSLFDTSTSALVDWKLSSVYSELFLQFEGVFVNMHFSILSVI